MIKIKKITMKINFVCLCSFLGQSSLAIETKERWYMQKKVLYFLIAVNIIHWWYQWYILSSKHQFPFELRSTETARGALLLLFCHVSLFSSTPDLKASRCCFRTVLLKRARQQRFSLVCFCWWLLIFTVLLPKFSQLQFLGFSVQKIG